MNLIQRVIAGMAGIRIPDLTRPIHNKAHKFGEVGEYFIGKKYTGRLLDGREWNEVPE